MHKFLVNSALASLGALTAAISATGSAVAANPYMSGPFEIRTTRPNLVIDTTTLPINPLGLSANSVAPSASSVSSPVANPFDIQVNFGAGVNAAQQAAFTQAESIWESLILGYKPGITNAPSSLVINAIVEPIDGVDGILGSAGPTSATNPATGGYSVATQGEMRFDSDDVAALIAAGRFGEVILHEMAHVIGHGTLWNTVALGRPNSQQVYFDGTGEYTGAEALAAYRAEFDPNAAFIPIERGGGPGTADAHWDEVDNGAGLTGLTNAAGQDFRDELMTGWLNSPTFISNTTVQSFADIGYITADLTGHTAVPTPAMLPGLIGMGLSMLRKKRKQNEAL